MTKLPLDAARASLPIAMQSRRDYQVCADRLKALADRDRLRIVTALLSGPGHVSQLADRLEMSLVNISHHLRVLRHADIVETEKRGKFVVYSLHPQIAAGLDRFGTMVAIDLGCCRLDLSKQPPADDAASDA